MSDLLILQYFIKNWQKCSIDCNYYGKNETLHYVKDEYKLC